MRLFKLRLLIALLTLGIGLAGGSLRLVRNPQPIALLAENSAQIALGDNLSKKPKFPRIWSAMETAAGRLEVVRTDSLAWSVSLNGEEILSGAKNAAPPALLEHVRNGVEPFDETLVLQLSEAGSYCNGGTFWFLGLKSDGTYLLSKGIGECFATAPRVKNGNNFIKVQIGGGYGNNAQDGDSYLPGGTWIFKSGEVQKLKPDTRWVTPSFIDLKLGTATERDVKQLFGKPFWEGEPEMCGGEEAIENKRSAEEQKLLQYEYREVAQGGLEIYVGRKTKRLYSVFLSPVPEMTRQEAVSKFGLDYFEVGASDSQCIKANYKAPGKKDSSDGVMNLVYPDKGLVITIMEDNTVNHIGYLRSCVD